MAWTQADLDAIDEAIASGVLTIRHLDGRSVTYQSTEDMMKARGLIAASLATPGIRSTYAKHQRD
jgi:hypothetical protein